MYPTPEISWVALGGDCAESRDGYVQAIGSRDCDVAGPGKVYDDRQVVTVPVGFDVTRTAHVDAFVARNGERVGVSPVRIVPRAGRFTQLEFARFTSAANRTYELGG